MIQNDLAKELRIVVYALTARQKPDLLFGQARDGAASMWNLLERQDGTTLAVHPAALAGDLFVGDGVTLAWHRDGAWMSAERKAVSYATFAEDYVVPELTRGGASIAGSAEGILPAEWLDEIDNLRAAVDATSSLDM